jgi:hypothetical protein
VRKGRVEDLVEVHILVAGWRAFIWILLALAASAGPHDKTAVRLPTMRLTLVGAEANRDAADAHRAGCPTASAVAGHAGKIQRYPATCQTTAGLVKDNSWRLLVVTLGIAEPLTGELWAIDDESTPLDMDGSRSPQAAVGDRPDCRPKNRRCCRGIEVEPDDIAKVVDAVDRCLCRAGHVDGAELAVIVDEPAWVAVRDPTTSLSLLMPRAWVKVTPGDCSVFRW